MELVKVPVPLPSVVLLLVMVGPEEVPQHIPLEVTALPASEIMLPPLEAALSVIELISEVVIFGSTNH